MTDHDQLDPRLKIVNVVLTANVGNSIDCSTIAQHLPNSEYNPRRFAALKHRQRHQGSAPTFLIYPSGKLVCAGAPSVEVAMLAFKRLFDYMASFQHISSTTDITIQNVVAHGAFGKSLNLMILSERFLVEATYEPELFPALKLDLPHGKMCANIFSSGKFVLTGTTSIQHFNVECARLFRIL